MKRKQLLIVLLVASISLFAQLKENNVLLYMPFDGNLDVSPSSVSVIKSETVATGNFDISYTDGKFGQSGVFDSLAYVTEGLDFNPVNPFFFSLWYYVTSAPSEKGPNQHTILHQKDSDGSESPGRILLEMLIGDNLDAFGSFVSGIRNDDTIPRPSGEWYHLAVTRDATNKLYLYVNGEERNVIDDTNLESNTQQIVIGGRKQEVPNYLAKGYIDDLMIANITATPSMVNDIMTNGVQAVLNGTGIKDHKQNEIIISFLTDKTFRVLNVPTESIDYSIYDLTGKLIKQEQVNVYETINMQNVNSGLYIINIVAGGEKTTRKILIR